MLRNGRIPGAMLENIQDFTSSIKNDRILAEYDIKQSIAHAKALAKASIINSDELALLIAALDKVNEEMQNNPDFFDGPYDDIHMAIEEKLGDIGKRLHAGRSRNDQVSCDMRMYCRDSILKLMKCLETIADKLKQKDMNINGREIIMPSYTHLQRAQTVDLSTYLDVFINWFKRDCQRLVELYGRVNQLPLGSAASACSNIKLDRKFLVYELGFDGLIENPMDAVSSRDHILEFAQVICITGIHFSRIAEEFILFSSKEFSFIELADSISETSSIMPQKKNPDVFELIRSASARLIGNMTGLCVMMKGLPLTYNRDIQNDKDIFNSVKTVVSIAEIFPDLIENITFNKERLREAASDGFTDAADFAEYLVLKKGMEFRTAHQLTGALVRKGLEKNYSMISHFDLEDIRKTVDCADEDVFEFIDIDNAVSRRLHDEKRP